MALKNAIAAARVGEIVFIESPVRSKYGRGSRGQYNIMSSRGLAKPLNLEVLCLLG